MKVQLTPSWILTDEHAASSYGVPVLVNRGTGEAYGPGDIVEPSPSWGLLPAGDAVVRMAKAANLSDEDREYVDRFNFNSVKGGETIA